MGWVYREMVHFTVPESGYYECTLYDSDHRIAFCTDCNLDRNRSLSRDSGNETEDAHPFMMGVTNIPMLNADIVTGISLMLLFVAFRFTLGFFPRYCWHTSHSIFLM